MPTELYTALCLFGFVGAGLLFLPRDFTSRALVDALETMPPHPSAHSSGLPSAPGRFASAWDAFQFACAQLADAQRRYFLAELVGDAAALEAITETVRFYEKAVAATEREWRKTGPAQ